MVENLSTEITEDEAALYDRQIRLWGLDAQKRIRGAKVLLVGVGGLGAEVAKNIILAGIKSLTLLDSEKVTEDDTCSQFFITEDDLNENRAERSLAQARLLNPMVSVTADTEDTGEKSDEFFTNFDIVIVTDCTKKEMIRINKICRENKIKYFAGNVHGFFGYTFADLIHHDYVEEIQKAVPMKPESTDGSSPKMRKEVKIMKKSTSFCSLENALERDWTSDKNADILKKLSCSYCIMQCLLEFRAIHGRNPDRYQKSSDVAELLRLRDVVLEKMGVNKDKVDDSFSTSVFAQLSPVCAIVGGILAQEVIKAISCKDSPLNNFFFYNSLQDSGTVEHVGG